jgi:hypothetical protein
MAMIWYNAHFIQKTDNEYTKLLESNVLISNTLTQTNINTAFTMDLCSQLVLQGKNGNWNQIISKLDSIKQENTKIFTDLTIDSNKIQKLDELIIARSTLIIQRDSLVNLVKNNMSIQAKLYLQNELADGFRIFFKTSNSYLTFVQKHNLTLSQEISERSSIIKKINQYIFWLPIACIAFLAMIILFVFYRLFSISTEEVIY